MPCYTDPHQGCQHPDTDISDKACEIKQMAESLENTAKYYKKKRMK